MDEHVAQAIINMNDTDIVLEFDKFWEELQLYFDDTILAVDKKRHSEMLHMPFAIFLHHLREKIIAHLLE